jgi:hydroxyacylglutathione hydrolase
MIFRRLYHDRLAQASYLIACEATRKAIVIDPLRDPTDYLEAASFEDVRIELVTETHLHADFLSGAEALARAAHAELLLSGDGEGGDATARIRRTGAVPLRHGDQLSVGTVRLQVRHTPGHTPEHLCFVVTDEATSEFAVGIVSGDFLFAGDVGRPDLLERAVGVTGSMQRSARELYRSLQALRDLPDYLQVWPGHGAGSACGKSLGAVPQSTLGYERRANWAFQIHDEEAFVRAVLTDQPEPPAYFARMKQINALGVPSMPGAAHAEEAALRDRVRDGVLVVDTRPSDEFLAHHLEGAISLPLGRSFLTYAGSVLDPARDLVLLMPADELHAASSVARELAFIGYDRVLGALPAIRFASFAPRTVATIPFTPVSELASRPVGVTLLDVRSGAEWNEGHVPGAVHVPLAQLTSRLPELRGRQPIFTYCQSGTRSATAASVLRAAGITEVSSVEGGFDAWSRIDVAAAGAGRGH